MKKTAYLSLGSNLGDRAANLREVTCRLQALGGLKAESSLFETEPVEIEGEQPWFINSAVALETELSPSEFMERALAIEQEMGRKRAGLKGPRRVDIDILLFGDEVIDLPGLTIPHPAMHRRRFVLEPLAEIAPEVRHPVLGHTIGELLAALPGAAVVVRKAGSREGAEP